jgi:elongation factor Ts
MAISAQQVKELREQTGAGIMDCKTALAETNGDLVKAVEHLRKSGIMKAAKKADRATGEGLIASYVHAGSKLAVLVEINCETDFVAKTDQFQAFAKDIAMHIAAQNPLVISREELPADILDKEREIYRENAIASGKPEKVIDRIVDGRVEKYYAEVCLLEQPFVKDTDITVEDLITQTIASLGENIRVARFTRMKLGDTNPDKGNPASNACCA